jgi:hypothetical protein
MNNLDVNNLTFGDFCFVKYSEPGVTPVIYTKYIWYGETDGWNKDTEIVTVIDITWGSITEKPNSSPLAIDNAVNISHKHNNSTSLNKISETSNGIMTFNNIPIGAVILFLPDNTHLPQVGQNNILYVIYKDFRLKNFPSISVWINNRYEILGRGLNDSPPPVGDMIIQQRELFSAVAGAEISITLSQNEQFAFLPIEVLKYILGQINFVTTYSEFNNSNSFSYNKDLIEINNGIYLSSKEIEMELDNISDRYYYSKEINLDDYYNVVGVY